MRIIYLSQMFRRIKAANPIIPVLAPGILKCEHSGDELAAIEQRNQFEANYSLEMAQALGI
jgi:hypothetical protein